eukprot:75882-Hanusia_phi.AAC.1
MRAAKTRSSAVSARWTMGASPNGDLLALASPLLAAPRLTIIRHRATSGIFSNKACERSEKRRTAQEKYRTNPMTRHHNAISSRPPVP